MACKNEIVNTIFKILDAKKAKDIEVLDVKGLTTLADYFILATGGSERQVQALCDHVEDTMEGLGQSPVNKEGYRSGDWVLVGYNDVIVHLFQSETRDFYGLERIWKDAQVIDMSDLEMEA